MFSKESFPCLNNDSYNNSNYKDNNKSNNEEKKIYICRTKLHDSYLYETLRYLSSYFVINVQLGNK